LKIFYKLKKDLPTFEAGTICYVDDGAWDEKMCRLDDGLVMYMMETLDAYCDNFDDWFEEVEQVFVKTKNAERIREIDEIADDSTDIASPFVKRTTEALTGGKASYPSITPLSPEDFFRAVGGQVL
jgi:hypothetical protein